MSPYLNRVFSGKLPVSSSAFQEPMQSSADDYVELEPTGDGDTRVTWRNTGDLPYPVGRYFGLGIDGMLGPQYEEGLQSLKAFCKSPEAEDQSRQ